MNRARLDSTHGNGRRKRRAPRDAAWVPFLAGSALLLFILAPSNAVGLTIVLDFNEASQGNTFDIIGNEVGPFDVTGFGFSSGQFGTVTNSVLTTVKSHYLDIVTNDQNPLSPIPAGSQLDIDFVLGNIGSPPSNGDAEYYFVQIGEDVDGGGPLGQAALSVIRNAGGSGPNFGVTIGDVVGTIFSDNINGLSGVGTALTSGNLAATTNALAGTASHEIGHALSLLHLNKAGSVTDSGVPPLMGTGAIDLPNIDRISDREFAFSGVNSQAGGAAQFHVQQLVGAIGLHSASSSAVPEPATYSLLLISLIGMRHRARACRRSRREIG